MVKVITYGTYDLLHYGHISLLQRAKKLGDYLIVGVTADDFDRKRGKINVKQSLMERIEAVRSLNIADEIIVEEYEGQKIDDIKRYNVDVFTVGSDWKGKFDYLEEYCKVVYLDRTEGISSSSIRSEERRIKLGLVGETDVVRKYYRECVFVNGVEVYGLFTEDTQMIEEYKNKEIFITYDYDNLLKNVDAVYIASHPTKHYQQVKQALLDGKHVLCESPIALKEKECKELFEIAKERELVLMDAIKTAYATAYNRLLLLIKAGKIGRVLSVDATCTSLREVEKLDYGSKTKAWNSISAWGPTAMLPIFQILGTDTRKENISSLYLESSAEFDLFTKIDFVFSNAVASIRVGKGVKSEGELVISGTQGYIYVPAPWWKTDYFEVRYENPAENERYFYQLDGEGIRYEIVAFLKNIETRKNSTYIDETISEKIVALIEKHCSTKNINLL